MKNKKVINRVSVIAKGYYLWLTLSCIIAIIPIWTVRYLPLGDYPIHLARSYVLFHYGEVAVFQQMYLILHEPIPNIGEEILIPLLMHLTNVLVAGKLFISLILVLFTFGVDLLAKNTRRGHRYIVLLMPFLFYCNQFFWGTLNYLFGLGLFFTAFAFWYRYRSAWRTIPLVALFGLVPMLYLAHLSAYALMVVACSVTLAVDLWKSRKMNKAIFLSILPLLSPLVLYVIFMLGTGHVGKIVWATPWQKVIALVPFLSHHLLIDLPLIVLLIVAVAVILRHRAEISIFTSYFAIASAFVVLYFFCPRVLFTSYGADVRVQVPAWIFFTLAFQFENRLLRYVLVATFSMMLFREVTIISDWKHDSQTIAEQVRTLDRTVPAGASVYPIWNGRTLPDTRASRALRSISCYTTIDRHIFTPNLIALRGQQPLVWRVQTSGTFSANNPDSLVNSSAIIAGYDYIFYIGDIRSYPDRLRSLTDSIAATELSSIWKLKRNR